MTKTLHVARLDFLTIRQYLSPRNLLFFAIIIFVLSFFNQNSSIAIGIVMMYALLYSAYPFAIGEKTKTDLLYLSLPLQKRNLVYGRYLFTLFLNLSSAVIALLFTRVVSVLLQQEFILGETLAATGSCFFLFTLMECIQLPFYFKLGYTKAKLFVFLPILVIPALIFFLFRLAQDFGLMASLTELGNQVAQNPLFFVFLALLFWVLAVSLSIFVSVQNYSKREF